MSESDLSEPESESGSESEEEQVKLGGMQG